MVLGEDFIRTARSKGLSERRVVVRHGLRVAVTPVFTQFGIDGLGREAITALGNSDLPVIVGIVLFGTVAIVVANIVVDLLYAVLDPRVRLR